MDQIIQRLCEAAGIELSEDQESLTDEQTQTLNQYLDSQSTKVADLEGKVQLLDEKITEASGKDPKIRKLEEEGFVEEAALLLEYKGDKLANTLSEQLGKDLRFSPVVKKLIVASVVDSDETKLHEALALVAKGDGVVDLSEQGHEGGGDNVSPEDDQAGSEIASLAETLMRAEKLTYSEALDRVIAEKPALWNQHQLSMGGNKSALVEVS